jgi:hypothetical protein
LFLIYAKHSCTDRPVIISVGTDLLEGMCRIDFLAARRSRPDFPRSKMRRAAGWSARKLRIVPISAHVSAFGQGIFNEKKELADSYSADANEEPIRVAGGVPTLRKDENHRDTRCQSTQPNAIVGGPVLNGCEYRL